MDIARAAFWSQMYEAGKINNRAFSLCFSRSPSADREGTEAGAMSMGGTDKRLHETPMVYSSTGGRGLGFYGVHVRKAYLREAAGGESSLSAIKDPNVKQLDINEAALNRGQIIVDSGTTDTYMSHAFGASLSKAWGELMGQGYQQEKKLHSSSELHKQPTILLQLAGDEERNKAVLAAYKAAKGADAEVPGLAGSQGLDNDNPFDVIVAFPPSHLYEFDDEHNTYISRLYTDEGSGGVLGANFMMGHDVYFDVNAKEVGWAESHCNYTGMLEQFFTGTFTMPTQEPTLIQVQDGEVASTTTIDIADETDDVLQHEPEHVFCSTLGCQIGFVFAVVGIIVAVASRVIRSGSRKEYDGAVEGRELQEKDMPSSLGGGFSDSPREVELT